MKISRMVASLFLFAWAAIAQAAPTIQHWTTDNGMRVYFVSAPELPMLDIELVFAGGSARDGDKAGVSMLTASILNKGADGMNADQIAEAFESVGAQFGSGSGMERSSINLRTVTLKEEKDKAISTWLRVISKPEFPEKDFKRSQKQALIGLQAEKQNPGSIASKTFYQHLYGDHPYASPENGTEESIQAMTLADLKAYYEKYYVAKNAVLAMVGDIDRKEAETLANTISKTIKTGEKAAAIPEVKPLKEAKTVRVDFPSSQSHVYIGQMGSKRGEKDYFTLYLGNHVFGGSGFTSRLLKEVRVKRGLSYSAYSYFMPQRELGPFLMGLQTKNEQVDEALQVSRDELKKFVNEGPDSKELEMSKKNITGGFPLRTASNADIASYISMIGFYGLPLDYLNRFPETINKITRDEVVDAFKRRVHPDKLLTIVVGKQESTDQEKDAEKNKETASAK